MSPPGTLLNNINLVLQAPVIGPLLDGVFWSAMCVIAAFLAPIVLLNGMLKAYDDSSASEAQPETRSRLGVVVTGCDSGFGRLLAIHLAQQGYTVFAGCLAPAQAGDLFNEAPAGLLRVYKMDVTSDTDVDRVAAEACKWVDEAAGRRLLAVTNNAGIGTGGPVDWLTIRDYERDLAVNYLGVIRVTKAFLPLLRRSASDGAAAGSAQSPRVLIVSSMSGKVPVPFLSSYSSSKHAVACFAASLRMEISALWKIHVCTALPSFHRTPLTEGGVGSITKLWGAVPQETRALYGEACARSAFQVADEMMSDWAWEPARVTEALARAVTQVQPPPCELTIGSDARFGLNVMRHLPPRIYEALIWHWIAWNLVKPAQAYA
eukprot:CAMPEP_0115844820 /NCGR_PEP_ID=MMETSP0287-20121206/9024_1 /TAXON_ID=412157 /ORGANISM="Chrysochromulina rotalis, Strain UIO044" /LENGTH=375 /DNA_ID=CAMNT_0003298555 /DNA_START=29 /DNA_END=1156 /DNA_ORIENTATION=-